MSRYLPALAIAALMSGAGLAQAQTTTMSNPSAPVNNSGHPANKMSTPGTQDASDYTKAAKRSDTTAPMQSTDTSHQSNMVRRTRSNDMDRASVEATRALNLLEANGYTGIREFHRRGDRFEALVTNDGVQQRVMVDPESRKIDRVS
jgi:hypothetical protein